MSPRRIATKKKIKESVFNSVVKRYLIEQQGDDVWMAQQRSLDNQAAIEDALYRAGLSSGSESQDRTGLSSGSEPEPEPQDRNYWKEIGELWYPLQTVNLLRGNPANLPSEYLLGVYGSKITSGAFDRARSLLNLPPARLYPKFAQSVYDIGAKHGSRFLDSLPKSNYVLNKGVDAVRYYGRGLNPSHVRTASDLIFRAPALLSDPISWGSLRDIPRSLWDTAKSGWNTVRNLPASVKATVAASPAYVTTAARLAAPVVAPVVAGAAAASPHVAAAVGGLAIGTGLAYRANRAFDAMDSDTWKTGGSRAEGQLELLGLGGEGTFTQAWKDAAGGAKDVAQRVYDLVQHRDIRSLPERMRDEVESENEARKKQLFKDNPNLEAELEAERRQRAANRKQDEQEQRQRERIPQVDVSHLL